jgi:3-hydroxyacyl-CoA dehydrogenase
VVVERLDIKQSIYSRVEQFRKPGTLITSNTSGIPIHLMNEGRSADFQKHFCGTHFFNPPRYLPLLEIIPGPDTDPAVIDFLMHYGDRILGKRTVLCKDTPAFIANRVGIYSIMSIFHLTEQHGLTVEEVDALTGPIIGHPKSATFRTCDVVGLDTAVKVAKGIEDNCPHDERRATFQLPAYVQQMVEKQLWGDKTGKGFFQMVKGADGSKNLMTLDLKTLEYRPQQKAKSGSIEKAKGADGPVGAMQVFLAAEDKYGKFFREFAYGLFAYVSHRVPEIADEVYRVDDAMRAGFGWGTGAFEKWDIAGVRATATAMKAAGHAYAPWVDEMLAAGCESFYKVEAGRKLYYDVPSKGYKEVPGSGSLIILDNLRATHKVWGNDGATLFDLGDGILGLEFHTKMNSMGQEVVSGINYAIDLAEKEWDGLVIGNQGENFSAGANIMMILMTAMEQEWDELNFMIAAFQNTMMRARYSSIPVVVAPHALTLGGGCELTLHADAVQAAAETYIGLVEVGVGLLPGGGGTKEFALRMSDRYLKGDVDINALQQALMTIAQAKVATSAQEAFGLGILQKHKDRVTVNRDRQLADAKLRARELADLGYVQPIRRQVRALGRAGLGAVEAGVDQMGFAGYASEHDMLITKKIGYVLCGGDLSSETLVTEQYLLDLEREAFLSLCGQRKTLERLQAMLQTGKPLRN